MAKGYKRHATGGSFKQNSFGDLGLREFRRQQSTIIDSLKLQQARSAEYSDQFLKGLKGVDQSEAENRKLLSDLENQVYENKRNAIAKRGQREVEALKGEAAELGKESKFWQDFAPKFSKGLAQTAVGLKNLADAKYADDTWAELQKTGQYEQFLQKSGEILSDRESDVHAAMQKAWQDKDVQAVTYLKNILEKSNDKLSQIFAKDLIKRSPEIELQIKEIVGKSQNLEWRSENIREFYLQRARELIRMFKISGKGQQELLQHFTIKGNAQAIQQQYKEESERLSSDRSQQVETIKRLKGAENIGAEIRKATISYSQELYQKANGEWDRKFGNPKEAHLQLARDLAATLEFDREEYMTLMLDTCTPGTGTKGNACVTWREKHVNEEKGTGTDFLDRLERTFTEATKKASENEIAKLDADDQQRLSEAKKLWTDDGLSNAIHTIEGYETVVNNFNAAKGLPKTQAFWAKKLHLKAGSTSIPDTLDRFWREANANDLNGAFDAWYMLPPEQRKNQELQDKHRYLKTLVAVYGEDPQPKIDKKAADHIKEQVGIPSDTGLTKALHPSAHYMKDVLVRVYGDALNDITSNPKYKGSEREADRDAWTLALKDLKAEDGLFKTRKLSIKGNDKKVFLYGERTLEEHTVLSSSDFISKWEKRTQDVSKDDQGSLVFPEEILGKDGSDTGAIRGYELRTLADRIVSGEGKGTTIEVPRNIHLLHKLLGGKYSKTDIINGLLKQAGYDYIRLNPNQYDILKVKMGNVWSLESGPGIEFSNNNVVALNVYADTVNQHGMPIANKFVHRSPIEGLAKKNPNLDWSSAYWENDVLRGIPFGTDYMDLIENRVQYGLDLDYDANGGIVFKRKIPLPPEPNWQHWITGQQSTEDYHAGMEAVRKRNRESK